MKAMVFAIVLAIVFLVAAQPASTTEPPIVYYSSEPNLCGNIYGATYSVYLWSPGVTGLTGASFDVQFSNFNAPLPASLIPAPGVYLNAFSVQGHAYHVFVSMPSREYTHEPLLTFNYSGDFDPGSILTTNVEFWYGSTMEPGPEWYSQGCCIDCFTCFPGFDVADRQLEIGRTTTFAFQWRYLCWTAGGGDLVVSDTEGWIASWTPDFVSGGPNCAACVIPFNPGDITMTIPSGVAPGTTTTVTMEATGGVSGTTTFVVEAVAGPVPVETTTWGAVKSLYR